MEHGPHAHALVQVAVPPLLHGSNAPMTQAPCPAHDPLLHWPHPSQVSVSVPQLPQDSMRVTLGIQTGAATHKTHWPPLQTWPLTQLVPSASLVHALVVVLGRQTSQGSLGFAAIDA